MHECPRCNHVSNHKNNMRNHFKRKKICIVTKEGKEYSTKECLYMLECGKLKLVKQKIEHKCEYCNKKFNRQERLIIHLDKCIQKNDIIINMKKKIEELEKNQQTNNQNITNNTTNNNHFGDTYNIQLNAYKDTDYSKLLSEDIIKCCLMDKEGQNVPKIENLLQHLHFNKDYPENHNLKIENRRTNKIFSYDGEGFIEERRDILEIILKNLEDVIEQSLDKTKGGIYMTKLRNHLDYMKKDEDYNYVVNDEMCRTMYNGKKMVNETQKNKA